MKALVVFFLGATIVAHAAAEATEPREAVVLLHGLGRTPRSMARLEQRLLAAGFAVHNLAYDSTGESFETVVANLSEELAKRELDRAPKLHFVGHSLGGILARGLVARSRPDNLGRIVMIAPPNHGSEIVDVVGRRRWFRALLGPMAVELGTAPTSLPNILPPPDTEIGVIAASRSWNPIGSWLIPGVDDGAVSIESTRLAGMADHVVVPRTHTFVTNDAEVSAAVVRFLSRGRFVQTAILCITPGGTSR